MSSIGIETAQNVVVQHEVASVGHRLVAYIIDRAILMAWAFIWMMVIVLTLADNSPEVAVVIGVLLILFPLVFYHLVSELIMDGKSIGKSIMKIKVARLDGGQPSIGQYLLRWLLRLVDGFYGLGLVVVLINGKGQRLGDLAAGTTVISLKQRLRLQDTLMTDVAPQHQVRFPEVVRLTDAQANMIKEVLYNLQAVNRPALIEEMAAKVRKVIANQGDGLTAVQFLQQVLRDYVFLTGQQGTR
jgi:uncharacterized RDD family membrane protein YckC